MIVEYSWGTYTETATEIRLDVKNLHNQECAQ